MKLYKLTQPEVGYDEYDQVLVRAEGENEARKIAHDSDLSAHLNWYDSKVLCEEVLVKGDRGLVMVSYNAG